MFFILKNWEILCFWWDFDKFFADLRKTRENLKLDGEVLIVGIVVVDMIVEVN